MSTFNVLIGNQMSALNVQRGAIEEEPVSTQAINETHRTQPRLQGRLNFLLNGLLGIVLGALVYKALSVLPSP